MKMRLERTCETHGLWVYDGTTSGCPECLAEAMAMKGPHPCHREGCSGTCCYIEDEYGGLAGGGDYEKWKCDLCGAITWAELPD